MRNNYFLSIILVFFLTFTFGSALSDANTVHAEESNGITISDFQVSNSNPSIGDNISFIFHVTAPDDKTVTDIQYSTYQGKAGSCGSGVQQNFGNDFTYTISNMEVIYYGTWAIDYVSITCSDGTSASFYNSSLGSYSYGSGVATDMSGSEATVQNDPNDTTAPVFDTSDITFAESDNNTLLLSMGISDNDEIAYVWPTIKIGNGGPCGCGSLFYNDSNGKWELNVRTEFAGTYEIISVTAQDRSGNSTIIYNTSYSDYSSDQQAYSIQNGYSVQIADLSHLDYVVESSNSGDVTGPRIDASSLRVESHSIGLWSTNKVYLRVTDDSDIQQVDVTWKQGKGGLCCYGGGFWYDSSAGCYVCNLTGQYYGTWQIESIVATDVNGNRSYLYNSAYDYYSPYSGYAAVDMSKGDFDVGISDEDTGIFVSGDGFGDTVSLDVEELSEEDSSYSKLIENGFYANGFWNIHMSGEYRRNNYSVKVKFKLRNVRNGSRVRIRHLLSNNTIQTKNAIVENGYVWIDVDQFSPFMIETVGSGSSSNDQSSNESDNQASGDSSGNSGDSNHTPPPVGSKVTVDSWKMTITGDSTVTYNGATSKKKKKISIPETVTVDGTEYTVTQISNKAFKGNKKLTKVTIPDTITKIGSNAFKGCKNLKKITIYANSNLKIGSGAFKDINKNSVITVKGVKGAEKKKIVKAIKKQTNAKVK